MPQRDVPRQPSRLGLAALLLGVLALPAALFPWLGLIIAVVVLAVSLVALILALRSPKLNRGYPMAAVVLAIVAVALAGVVSSGMADRVEDCGSTSDEELEQCLEDGRTDG
ncbi:MAG: hypothetical protein ACTH1D_14615 [Mycobacteriaceae bacterium]|uniref:hypothetical protein n=1 Tax=Corynebacterium sp. TaxID=1720 RepID=UPI003F9B8A7F